MARKAAEVVLSKEERANIERRLRKRTEENGIAIRLKIVLLASENLETQEIAKRLGISKKAVCKWRNRYAKEGLPGLEDRRRAGRLWKFSSEDRLKIITEACRPPKDTTHWTVRDLKEKISKESAKSISHVTVHRILKSTDLKPHQYQMWLNSQDPDFEAKQIEVIGLYMEPPENVVVLSVDERTGMQALGRKYPSKPMKPGPSREN